jgi:hypothetical protein
MCSHIEEEPGPPLKAKVTAREACIGSVADAGNGLVVVVTDDQHAGGSRVIEALAAEAESMLRDGRLRNRQAHPLIFFVAFEVDAAHLRHLRRGRRRFAG